jgi:hypothetical protein
MPQAAACAPKDAFFPLVAPRYSTLVDGNERKRCGKRHLKARMHDRFGRDQHDRERGEREVAQSERRAVDHHPDQHNRDHDERTLGGDFRARQNQIKRRCDQRRYRTPFLDWIAQRHPGYEREPSAQHEEHDAGHHRHVIARYREDVREARYVHRIVDRGR